VTCSARCRWPWIAAIAMLCLMATAFALDGTPQQALVEILLATQPEIVEKHLPESIRQELRHLDPDDRRECESQLLIGNAFRQNGTSMKPPDDGHALLVMQAKDSDEKSELRVQRELTGGDTAFLEVVVDHHDRGRQDFLIWMQLEDGEWRVTELQFLRFAMLIDDAGFLDQFRRTKQKQNEAAAVARLRTLQYALQAYASAYPEVGLPNDLAVLAAPAKDVPQNPAVQASEEDEEQGSERDVQLSSEYAGLVDSSMASNESVERGYRFQYTLRRGGTDGAYIILARPLHFQKGARSFYTDESGVVRSTDENRDATPEDEPAQH
jgi:hypothetical protein